MTDIMNEILQDIEDVGGRLESVRAALMKTRENWAAMRIVYLDAEAAFAAVEVEFMEAVQKFNDLTRQR